MRGISLDEIAVATKIGTRSLKALEDENFSILPGGIFNKGFVRSYAKFLGLNEDEAVADYTAAVKEQPVSVKTIASQSAMAKANRLAAQQARESSHKAGIVRALILLVLSAGIAFGGYKVYRAGYFKAFKMPSLHRQLKQQAQAPTPTTSVPSTTSSATSAPPPASQPTVVAPADNATSSPASTTVSKPESRIAEDTTTIRGAIPLEFTVSIKATGWSWMSITMDGRRPLQKTFAPHEQKEFKAKNRVRIVMGNPNGTEISLNGKPVAISGDLTRPRTVVVNASGLQSE
ncbi:conserved hypothetical protein [Candidatus Koribacter versatilis Ellin345]|uniref:Cytoskeleton protein RodZ-like C-terminal domain-containing protein n=2 Tax=Candidatus Korobacter versatilis TaxID=658062 RepID=Q1IKD9_KORVE|nr:conserved hypothetical protein [Candidatus Koribacter versatilis Ellin345]